MTYQTGQTTDPEDLLAKIVTFCTGIGYTVNLQSVNRAHLSKGDLYVNLRASIGNATGWFPWEGSAPSGALSTQGSLHLYLSESYDAEQDDWHDQPGGPIGNSTSHRVGSAMKLQDVGLGSYHFFANNDNVVIYVEQRVGIWVNMGWGHLIKAGSYTGGRFFFGSSTPYAVIIGGVSPYNNKAGYDLSAWASFCDTDSFSSYSSGFVRVDCDAFADKWACCSAYPMSGETTGGTGKAVRSSAYGGSTYPLNSIAGNNGLAQRAVSSMTSQVTLMPIRVFVARDTSPGGYSLIGTVSDAFECWSNFTPTTLVELGEDTYMLFPHCAIRKVV